MGPTWSSDEAKAKILYDNPRALYGL